MIHATMLQQTSVSISKGSSANYIQSADFALNTTEKKVAEKLLDIAEYSHTKITQRRNRKYRFRRA